MTKHTPPKWVTEPDKFRRGVGLYVRFSGQGATELFPIDPLGGDRITYGEQEIVIVKHDADGTERQIGILKHGIDWYREHVIAIPFDARKAQTHVQPRSRPASSKRR